MTLRVGLLIGCIVVDLFAGIGTTHAEFQMAGPTPAAPVRAEIPDLDTAAISASPRKSQRVRNIPVTSGFGRQVPLSFALRQIVPKEVTVAASDDIDPDAVLIDWSGGRPWPDVIRAALRRSGFRATIKPGLLLIEHTNP